MVKRVLVSLATLLAVSVVIFIVADVLPGDVATRVLGRESTAEQREVFRERLNLDAPAAERYVDWLGGVVRGDFGESVVSGRPVTEVVGEKALNTLFLGVYALILYIPVVLFFSIVGAMNKGRWPDTVTSGLTLVGLSLPEFVLANMLVLAFALWQPWFPPLAFVDPGMGFTDRIHATTLPALTLTVPMAVYAIRMLRGQLVEILDSEYVRMCTLRGIPRHRILISHALPNGLGPALKVTALNLAYLISGVVVVEEVFSYDGLGALLVATISTRDIPVLEALVLLGAATYIIANLLSDIATTLLVPRLRTGR